MSIVIRNLQRSVTFNEKQFYKNVELIRHVAGYSDFDLGIMLVCDEEMAEINQTYRGLDESTDVLAFPFHQISVENAGYLHATDDEEKMLGDLVLGMPYIRSQCEENKTHLMNDMMTHVTHGVCHLVGYDHQTPSSWKAMYNKELQILQKFNEMTGYRCSPLLKVGHYS